MKKLIIGVVLALGFTVVSPVNAADEKVLVIIDSAIDSSKIPGIVYEACFTSNKSCANETSFAEGPGTANVPNWSISKIDHGYNITQAAKSVAPDVKIVFIRISDVFPSSFLNSGAALSSAIKWVSENASKYSVDAVSISQSRINFTAGTCPTDLVFSSAVQSLKAQGIPVHVATGNDGKNNMVGFPSCVTDVIGVGATKPSGPLATYTNSGPGMDVVFRGDIIVKNYKNYPTTITGTSVAAPMFSALYVANKL